MTGADRALVRYLGGIIAAGFAGVALTLALTFGESLWPFLGALLPLITLLVADQGRLQPLEEEPTAATDGGRQLSETDTGGSQNSRNNT